MSCPVQRAENDPFTASRTNGWWRARMATPRNAPGRVGAVTPPDDAGVGDARPAPEPPRTTGRSSAATPARLAARPVPARIPPGRSKATGPATVTGWLGSKPPAGRPSGQAVLRATHEAGEQEEREAGAEDHVADRHDIAEEGQWHRDHVAQRPRRPEEASVQCGRQDHVDGREHVCAAEARRREARFPDRHEAAVHEDRGGVERDPDQREAHARPRPVRPQPRRKDAVSRSQEREPQCLDDRDVPGERGLRPEAERERAEDQERPAEAEPR